MADEHKVRVGARIREARKAKGWSQRALAHALPGRVDGPSVSRWERGLVLPHVDTLQAIANVLDVTVAYFYETPEDEQASNGDGAATPDMLTLLEELVAGQKATFAALKSLREDVDEMKSVLRMREAGS